MRSPVFDLLPANLQRALKKLGLDINIARRKRRLCTAMMAERVGVAISTYLKIEKGDPSVSMGVYAMVLFVLGFTSELENLIDQRKDDQGLLLESDRLPKRIHGTAKHHRDSK